MPVWHPSPTSWPAAGTTTVTLATGSPAASQKPAAALTPAQLAGPSSGSVSAGQLPLHIGPAATAGRRQAPGRVTVSMGSHQAAGTLGIPGVVFALAQPAAATSGTSGPADAHVSLDYSSFADAYGGDYASRLRLVELPACALTTPKRPACRAQTPLRSANDVRTDQLGADVSLPAASAAQPDHGAGSHAGAVRVRRRLHRDPAVRGGQLGRRAPAARSPGPTRSSVPPVPGGLEPTSALSYDSQARGRADLLHQQPGVLDRRRLGLLPRLHRAVLPVVPARTGRRRPDRRHVLVRQQHRDPVAERADTTLVQDDTTGA